MPVSDPQPDTSGGAAGKALPAASTSNGQLVTGGTTPSPYVTIGNPGSLYKVPSQESWNLGGGLTAGIATSGKVDSNGDPVGEGNFTGADNNTFVYADPTAFANNNAGNIYNLINQGINSNATQQAPQATNTMLGNASQLSPAMMLSGAQIAPQATYSGAQLSTDQDNQYAAAQNQQINALNATAQGLGPSVATTQAQQLAQQNIAAQMAALGSQRGSSSSALGQRAAATQAATANQAAAQQGALGRAQEALAAQGQLTSALSGARGQSQTTAQTQAQLAQQANLANTSQLNAASTAQANLNQAAGLSNQQTAYNTALQNANLAQAGMLQQGSMNQQTNLANLTSVGQQNQVNAQQYEQYLNQYMQEAQNNISNQASAQQLLGNEQLGVLGTNTQTSIANNANSMGLAGAGISGVGALAAAAPALLMPSDRNLKRDVRSANQDLRVFLSYFVS